LRIFMAGRLLVLLRLVVGGFVKTGADLESAAAEVKISRPGVSGAEQRERSLRQRTPGC
jgi:hypothetical protein